MQGTKVLFIGGLLLAATPAFADGDAPASPDPNAGGGGGAGAAPAVTAGGEGGGGGYSGPMIERPYVVEKGKIGAYGDFDIVKISIPPIPPLTMSTSLTAEFLHLGAGYGVNEKITAGADIAFNIHDDAGTFNGAKPIRIFGEYQLAHDSKLSVTASADVLFDIDGGTDAMGNSTTNVGIEAGVAARYLVAPKIGIYTGAPVGPGPVGTQLQAQLTNSGPINFSIPAGVAIQATPELFAYLQTNLITLHLANKAMGQDAADVIFSTAGGIPLSVGGLFAVNKQIDAGVQLNFPDLKHAGDIFEIGLIGRIHI
jgi:hypothetical protein